MQFGLHKLLVLLSTIALGIAVYHQGGRGPIAEYTAKQWVLDVGGTITYTYTGNSRTVRVTIPSPSSEHSYEPNDVLCIRAIRGVTQVSLWGHEFVLASESGHDGDSFQVDWETLEKIIAEIERL